MRRPLHTHKMRNALEKLSSASSAGRLSVSVSVSLAAPPSSPRRLSRFPLYATARPGLLCERARRRPCHIQYSRIPLKDSIYFYS